MPPARIALCQLPTPLHRLEGMSRALGIDLWIKRDDLTGFAMGGNKGRKLEYLMADARDTDVVVSCGAAQSNFVRQLAAACAVGGKTCAVAVMDLPYEPVEDETSEREAANERHLSPTVGNPTLNRILGVDLRHHPDGPWETLYAHTEALAQEYEAAGKRVYRIPIGGSSPLGAYAFFRAAEELPDDFDWIVAASSSGSTQTGLAYAFRGTRTKVLGILSDPEPEMVDDFAALGDSLADLLDLPDRLAHNDFRVDLDFVGEGYGIPSPAGDAAIARLARTEGIFLDPVYSGKAFAGLIDLVERGELGGKVLFWHTGGLPTLFAR